MKKNLLLGVVALLGFNSFAQDTTVVQTYTFDTIVTRRANFQFPSNLDTSRFEKVLMYYKLKCSPLTTWDQYNCGEWDYLTYTHIYEHTGLFDSTKVTNPLYKVNTNAPVSYAYANQAYYDQQYRLISNRLPLMPITSTIAGAVSTPLSFVSPNGNGNKLQWVISATDLAANGILAGDIQAMNLSFLAAYGELEGVKIRIKHTNLANLSIWETTGFTTVYDSDIAAFTAGLNALNFATPFTYNGTDNIVIELSYNDAHLNMTGLDLAMQTTGSSNSLIYANKNNVFRTGVNNFAEVNMNNVDLGQDVTVMFWAKGNGSFGTNTSVLEAVDSLNNRIFNIHFPWSDNSIYFDAGEGSGYDRISKVTTAADIDNNWHHWAFVKKTSTGQMFIFKDGVQWHTGTNMNRPVGLVDRLFLGSNWNQQYQYNGDLDEFTIWDAALSGTIISQWMNKKIDNTHPQYANLQLYYDFDGQEVMMDRSGNNRLGMTSAPNMVTPSVPTMVGTTNIAAIPVIELTQGTFDAPTQDSVLTAKFPETSVKFNYNVVGRRFDIASNEITYTAGTMDTLVVNGTTINAAASPIDVVVSNDTLFYYKTPVEQLNDIEIGRFITPYGIGFNLGPNGFTWVYDVTDYQKYLHGNVDFAAGNTQELLDVKFVFVHGIPGRDVVDVAPIWNNFGSLNFADMANDVVLSQKSVILDNTAEMYKIRTRLTGHGQVGNAACCEWVPNVHKINVNGTERFSWNIFRPDACGENPNIAQGGTWPYAREGWCPGDLVPEFEHELTPYVSAGDTINLDYDITDVPVNDPGQAGGNYIVAMDLVSYSAPNFQRDAAIVDVLNPNNYEYYSKWNPTCSNPKIILKNNGEQNLTSCKIRCWVSYGTWLEYQWAGNLPFLGEEVVEIPITDQNWWFGANPANGFYAQVYDVNGQGDDEYAKNNLFHTMYDAPEVINGPFFVWMTTNNKASENKWKLIDQDGAIIFQRTTLTNATDYKDTFNLAPGCYALVLEDSDDDGLSFWYSSQVEGETSGAFRVRKVGGSIVEIFPGDFGSYHRYDFSVGFTLGNEELPSDIELNVFPNPANDNIRVELVGYVGNSAEIQICDMNGRVLQYQNVKDNNHSVSADFNISALASGYYVVRVTGLEGTSTIPFIKQ